MNYLFICLICFLWAVRSYAEILCTLQLYAALCLTIVLCSTKKLRVILLIIFYQFFITSCVCAHLLFFNLSKKTRTV